MSVHVQEHYGESISPAQLGVILDLCDQQDDGMNGEKDECLVCGEELSFLALQRHLATHMEDMALFVLPNTQEGQDMGGTNDSVQAELKSKGQLSDTKSQTSSLGFSTAGDNGQTRAEFSKLLTSEEEGYSSKFIHWQVNDDSELASLHDLLQDLEDQDEEVRQAAVEALSNHPALPYEIVDSMGRSHLESRGRYGQTVLSRAARKGREVTCERLIERGADFQSKDEDGWTPLHLAATAGNVSIAKMLIEAGADLESRDVSGHSPLHGAAEDGHKSVVEMLLQKGANFESRNDHGQSPLHGAANYGREAIVRMLLEIGADDQLKDKYGQTPLSLATKRGDEATIRLLQQHADSPASRQSSEAYHSTPDNASDGTSLAKIDLDSLPPLYKKVGQDWHAVFNPQLQRDLDVDLVHVFKHSYIVDTVRFSHDGMYIATSSGRTARIFDIQTGEQVCALDHSAHHAGRDIFLGSVSFSPDDQYLATGGGEMIYVSQFATCSHLQLD